MTITREQLEQLARIYNTMMNISTKGEDTFVMADCLRALEQVVTAIDKAANSQDVKSDTNTSTPEVVED